MNAGGTGDLHVRVQLWTPERLTEEERQLVVAARRAAARRAGGRSRQRILGENEGSARRVTPSDGGDGGWTVVRVIPGANPEAVIAALVRGRRAGPARDRTARSSRTRRRRTTPPQFTRAALAASADARVETSPLPQVDWSEEWKRGLRVQTARRALRSRRRGSPTISTRRARSSSIPAWRSGPASTPRRAASFDCCKRVIEPGDRVADLGAGSAVLAIAAAKLGASHVAAIEIDPDAIGNAEENVERNGVADRVVVIEGDAATLLPLVAPVQLITANIISSVLIELLPLMASAIAEGGHIILSGILFDERDMMTRVLGEAGWRIDAEDREESWWSATIARQ